jgi:hypothetical protein
MRSLWTADEDIQLKAAVRKHGSKNWVAIAGLIQGRTVKQCSNRWTYYFKQREGSNKELEDDDFDEQFLDTDEDASE